MSKSASGDHATTDRLTEHAHESVDQVAKTAGKAEEHIRSGAADAEARAREAGQRTRERYDDTLESISVFVQDKPLISLGLAFAAGALLSASKRRS